MGLLEHFDKSKKMKKEQPERRRYKRIRKNFVLTYFDLADPLQKYNTSQLKNIGLGGMCLITPKPFAPSTILGIELKTPFVTELTHLEGKVMESHEKIKDIIYETRLEFNQLTPPAKFVLNKIIEYFVKEEKRDE